MNMTSRQFEGLLSRYFERLLEDEPRFAVVSAGLSSGEGKLGRMTLEHQGRRERERQAALRALEGVSPRELSSEQQLDRLALRSLLLKECEDYARGRHALEPNAPAQLLDILLHELMRGDDEPQRAAPQPAFAAEAGAGFSRRRFGSGSRAGAGLAASDGGERRGQRHAARRGGPVAKANRGPER